jgi:hypothetical protein
MHGGEWAEKGDVLCGGTGSHRKRKSKHFNSAAVFGVYI